MAVRAISFDLFDTLLDLEMENLPRVVVRGRELHSTVGELHQAARADTKLDLDAFADALMKVDGALRKTAYEADRELPTLTRFKALCDSIGITSPDLPQRLTEVHMGLIVERASLPEGHLEVLAVLAERAERGLGLCSNFSHTPTVLDLLRDFGLRPHLRSVVVSETVGRRKPNAEIFNMALRELGVNAAETLHVGDNLVADIQGAAALGMRTVWITRRVRDPDAALSSYEGKPPDFQIRDLAELPAILDSEVSR